MSKDMVDWGGGEGREKGTGLPFPDCIVTESQQRLYGFQKLLLLSIIITSINKSKPSARTL